MSSSVQFAAVAVRPGLVAQRYWGAELAEVRGAAEDCSRRGDLCTVHRSSPSTIRNKKTLGVGIQPFGAARPFSVLRGFYEKG